MTTLELLKERRAALQHAYHQLVFQRMGTMLPDYEAAKRACTSDEEDEDWRRDPASLAYPNPNGTGTAGLDGAWVGRASSLLGNIQGLNYAIALLDGTLDSSFVVKGQRARS